MRTLVKICGLTRRIDAIAAAEAGAAYGGVILAPGRSRTMELAGAADLFAGVSLRRVGVFVDAERDGVRRAVERVSLDVVQLHGDELPDAAAALRERGGPAVWKALRPRSADDFLQGVARFAAVVDGILLDGWSPDAHGGTGASFSWDRVAPHLSAVPDGVELIVAGGLTPDNVARAARLLRPRIVDVSSGVESEVGKKDHRLIRAFVDAAADPALSA
jgi:phosphoribosylanthranilate isomerase